MACNTAGSPASNQRQSPSNTEGTGARALPRASGAQPVPSLATPGAIWRPVARSTPSQMPQHIPQPLQTPPPLNDSAQTPIASQYLPQRQPVSQTAGSRRRQRRNTQAVNPLQSAGITQATWSDMAQVDAAPILQQNIIALNKCPTHFRNLWRFAVAEVNQAGQSPDPLTRKGAEITLALLPNMLLRAPSPDERLMSTRQKMDARFAKFFAGTSQHSYGTSPNQALDSMNNRASNLQELTLITWKSRKKGQSAEQSLSLQMG